MQNVKLAVFLLAVFASSYSWAKNPRLDESEPSFSCPTSPENTDVLLVVYYSSDPEGDEGPLFLTQACGYNGYDVRVINHRKIRFTAEPNLGMPVHMQVQLHSSVTTDNHLSWNSDAVWINEHAAPGEVPKPGSWCAQGTKPTKPLPQGNLFFDLCAFKPNKKDPPERQAVELRLKSDDQGMAGKDIRVDPQIVHKANVLRQKLRGS